MTLLREATHWVEEAGERVCYAHYETSILWSMTHSADADEPPVGLEDFLPELESSK
jgi:hypothetical protein